MGRIFREAECGERRTSGRSKLTTSYPFLAYFRGSWQDSGESGEKDRESFVKHHAAC